MYIDSLNHRRSVRVESSPAEEVCEGLKRKLEGRALEKKALLGLLEEAKRDSQAARAERDRIMRQAEKLVRVLQQETGKELTLA